VALQVRAVLVPRHLSRPGAVGIPGRRRDVFHRRGPGVVVLLVVLRPERLEDELGSLETERDVEVGRDDLGHATDRRRSAPGELGKRTLTWASVRKCPLTSTSLPPLSRELLEAFGPPMSFPPSHCPKEDEVKAKEVR
jgi:hypothetical protein